MSNINNYSSVLPSSGYYSSRIITQNTGGIRSRSMEDHRHLPLSVADRAIYKPKKEYYTGELFEDNNQQNIGGKYYRSSSAERIGNITVVPIRREATLPSRRFHSELRSNWKREENNNNNNDNYGFITKQKTIGDNLYFDRYSTFDNKKQQKYEERPQTNFDFWRDRYKMEAIKEPKTNISSYTINYPNGSTTAAEYSSFQQNADNEGGTAMKHFQHTKHQQNQREYKEWHSGDKQQQRRSAADSYTTMGTLRNSAEERQARKAIQYHQKHGEGDNRHYRQNYEYYINGGNIIGQNYKNKSKNDKKWQKNNKSSFNERWYDGRKQEEYIDQKQYRKIRFCCFDIFWPPGGIKQTYRPSPQQKMHKSISQQPSPIPLEHRPFNSYNHSLPHYHQTDNNNNPIYREKGKELYNLQNGRQQLPTSESSFGQQREIPLNREQHNYYKR